MGKNTGPESFENFKRERERGAAIHSISYHHQSVIDSCNRKKRTLLDVQTHWSRSIMRKKIYIFMTGPSCDRDSCLEQKKTLLLLLYHILWDI